MPQHLSSGALTAMLIGFVLLHVALVVSALFYRKVNPLFLLAGVFIILSPISGATEMAGTSFAKWARVYVSLLMVIIGLFGYRIFRIGFASKVLLAFTGFYVFAAVWSDMPIMGLLFKSLFAVTLVSGMFLAYSARDRYELARGIRFICIVGGLAGLVVILAVLYNPNAALTQGRLWLLGMNPNRIGLTVAPLLILCGYLALYDPSRIAKGLGYVVGIALALIILYTGSRAATGTAAIGCFVIALPLIKKPIQATFVASVVVICVWVAAVSVQTEGALRLFELAETSDPAAKATETRLPIWREGYRIFRRSPLVGVGWVHITSRHGYQSSLAFHNMYLQVMIETGLLGLSMFTLCFVVSIFRGVRMFISSHRYAPVAHLAALSLGLLIAHAFHGLGESALLMGGTLGAMFLGFSVGLIDHLPELMESESNRTALIMPYPTTTRRSRWRRGTAGPEAAS